MFNALYLHGVVQVLFCVIIVAGATKSQPQEYRAFFNGPQRVYQQRQTANINSQKWYYSSNNQPTAFSWQWTNQDAPSSNFYRNPLPFKQLDQLSDWACGRSSINNRFARIMGGRDAVPHAYPWMVSLAKRSLDNAHICGGVLLTRRHVLSAAHCMEDFEGAADMSVIAGTYYTSDKRRPASVMAMTVHPRYDPETFANDVAIVTLLAPMPDNDPWIGTICLPPDNIPGKSYPPSQTSGVAIGWGSTYFGGEPSPVLKQVVLPILETTRWPCNLYVTYAEGQICAGELSGGADTCQADSGSVDRVDLSHHAGFVLLIGGPLMIENSENRWEVVGITSFGKSCGKPNTPGIYTRVSTYNSFIRSTVGLSNYNPYYSLSSTVPTAHTLCISIILLLLLSHT